MPKAISQLTLRLKSLELHLAVLISAGVLFALLLLRGGEGIRHAFIGVMVFLFALILMSDIKRGLLAILIYLPFVGFIRRLIYTLVPYTKFDLIHLVVPVLSFSLFCLLLAFRKDELSVAIRGSKLAKIVIALFSLFILQIFNPLQGSLFVGLGGALFYLIPMLWFFFGLLFADDKFLQKLLYVIIAIGIITAAYGLYQMVAGFLPFEEYWIKHGGFGSLHVGQFIRGFSTFASAEEWSRYIQIAGTICFAFFLTGKNPLWFLAFAFISFAVVMTGVRSSIFGLAFSVLVVLGIWRAHTVQRSLVRFAILGIMFFLVTTSLSSPSQQEVYQSQSAFYTLGGHTARGLADPLGETTFQGRLTIWNWLFTDLLPKNPVGFGLGLSSIAATKFGSSNLGVESYAFSIFVNSGFIGGLLFLTVTLISLKKVIELCFQERTHNEPAITVFAMISGLTLNNFFGNSFSLYSIAPLGWLLIGWIASQEFYSKEVGRNEG